MYINNIINIPNNIRTLNIDFCDLKSISNLPLHGDRISLQNNKLKTIPQIGERLTELNISNNKIEQIEMLPKNVTHFYASHNKLRKIPITVENKNLSIIELDYNLIDTIPECINELTRISELNLNKNRLKIIDIPSTSKINRLNISNNKISEIKSLPEKLRNLNVAKNKLTEFNIKLDNLSNINLSNNNLTTLNTELFKNADTLNLSYNKLQGEFTKTDFSSLNIKGNKISSLKLSDTNYSFINVEKTNIEFLNMIQPYIYVEELKHGKIKNPCIKLKNRYNDQYIILNANSPDIKLYNLSVTNV